MGKSFDLLNVLTRHRKRCEKAVDGQHEDHYDSREICRMCSKKCSRKDDMRAKYTLRPRNSTSAQIAGRHF